MPHFASARRFFAIAVVSLALLAVARTGVHGQESKADTAMPVATGAVAPAMPLAGTGEQMRAIAAVCESWEAAHSRAAKTGGKKRSADGPQDSSDIRDYNFEVTQEGAIYKIALRPRKPAVLESSSPQGTYLMNNSSTFFYEVRRSDFKIVGVSAIL